MNAHIRPREEVGLAVWSTAFTTAMSPALLRPLITPVRIANVTIVREYLVMNEMNFIWTIGASIVYGRLIRRLEKTGIESGFCSDGRSPPAQSVADFIIEP